MYTTMEVARMLGLSRARSAIRISATGTTREQGRGLRNEAPSFSAMHPLPLLETCKAAVFEKGQILAPLGLLALPEF